jgi:acyl-CoA thioester hydrolase
MTPFSMKRRIEFCETDMAGIVHFSNYFRLMEAAETEFLRSLGLKVSWSERDEHFGFPRVSVSCDYFKPLRFEDVVEIAVTVEKIGRRSVTYRFDFSLQGALVATGRITAVLCRHLTGQSMQSLDIPDQIRALLEKHFEK